MNISKVSLIRPGGVGGRGTNAGTDAFVIRVIDDGHASLLSTPAGSSFGPSERG